MSKNWSDLCPHVWIPADLMPRNVKLYELLHFALCEAFLHVHFYTFFTERGFLPVLNEIAKFLKL